MRKTFMLALAGAALSLTPAVASAQIVSNGGFELPVISDPCCNTVPPDSLPGWTVLAGSVNVVNGTYGGNGNLAYEADQYLDLVGQSAVGAISQDIATVAGQVYHLTFAYANNIFAGATTASAVVSIGTLLSPIIHTTSSTTDLDWTIFTGYFVGTGDPMTLLFNDTTGTQNGSIFLDAVTITAVPEPATWAMMILGFGLAGMAVRRRKRKLAFA